MIKTLNTFKNLEGKQANTEKFALTENGVELFKKISAGINADGFKGIAEKYADSDLQDVKNIDRLLTEFAKEQDTGKKLEYIAGIEKNINAIASKWAKPIKEGANIYSLLIKPSNNKQAEVDRAITKSMQRAVKLSLVRNGSYIDFYKGILLLIFYSITSQVLEISEIKEHIAQVKKDTAKTGTKPTKQQEIDTAVAKAKAEEGEKLKQSEISYEKELKALKLEHNKKMKALKNDYEGTLKAIKAEVNRIAILINMQDNTSNPHFKAEIDIINNILKM